MTASREHGCSVRPGRDDHGQSHFYPIRCAGAHPSITLDPTGTEQDEYVEMSIFTTVQVHRLKVVQTTESIL